VIVFVFLNREKSKKEACGGLGLWGVVVTKGLPWTVEEEALLKALVEAKTSLSVMVTLHPPT
jgi:hypothetical protein